MPLSEEEFNKFKADYPEFARYFEAESNYINTLPIPDVSESAPIYDHWDKAAKRLL